MEFEESTALQCKFLVPHDTCPVIGSEVHSSPPRVHSSPHTPSVDAQFLFPLFPASSVHINKTRAVKLFTFHLS